jgi:2-phosphoglycerate kinase
VLAVPVVVTVEDEDVHRSHFVARRVDSSSRPFQRYLAGFQNIRRVQKYVKSQALMHGVQVIPNYSLDQALSAVIDLVVERATEQLGTGPKRRRAVKQVAHLEGVGR